VVLAAVIAAEATHPATTGHSAAFIRYGWPYSLAVDTFFKSAQACFTL
jgi:hypothetical protein